MHKGQILGRVVGGNVELRFETEDAKVVTTVFSPEDFAAFVQAMALLAEELWPPDAPDANAD